MHNLQIFASFSHYPPFTFEIFNQQHAEDCFEAFNVAFKSVFRENIRVHMTEISNSTNIRLIELNPKHKRRETYMQLTR